ncbi:hypothetical protein GN109_05955 [Collimonas pratensis]|uniref:hypothetical protein n=1 Tax=Collimonas pratensis TaxID=279113 RepID=UPI00143D7451|nr:hypothetical protein [Collimonas pratensis]NKI68957.1 hypothetical protein [Collimonas pratensis]
MSRSTFTGGEKLQSVLAELAKKVSKSATVETGFLEGATYPDGTSVPMVAALNEFGHMVQSKDGDYFQMPRAFFRGMIAENSPTWGEDLGKILVATDYDSTRALDLMGEHIGSQLQESIIKFNGVPLAESTIKKKGFDTQLRDTGHMLNSVDHKVIE